MRLVEPTRSRVYSVFWRWRQRPEEQEYDLAVPATTVERAIAKVKKTALEEYAGSRADIIIDAVELRDPEDRVSRWLKRIQRAT